MWLKRAFTYGLGTWPRGWSCSEESCAQLCVTRHKNWGAHRWFHAGRFPQAPTKAWPPSEVSHRLSSILELKIRWNNLILSERYLNFVINFKHGSNFHDGYLFSGVTIILRGAVFLNLRRQRFMDERRQEWTPELQGSCAPAVGPRSAPVLWHVFSWWQAERGCADDVAGSAQLVLRDLLMSERVFDDSCKNLRLRVSFTAVRSLSSNLPC